MRFKSLLLVILILFCSIQIFKATANSLLDEEIVSNSNSSLLLEFNKRLKKILNQCENSNSSQKICNLINIELLPIFNALLKSEKLKQNAVQMEIGQGRNCLLRNRQYPEYFYAAGNWLKQFSIDERLVLTWLPGWFDDECYWNFEPLEGESESQYRLKSTKFDEYLYGSKNYWHDNMPERRYVFTWRKRGIKCEEQCLWKLSIIKTVENKVYFTIQNIESGEYLYADDDLTYETNSRYVFTKKLEFPKEIRNNLNAQWIIDCK